MEVSLAAQLSSQDNAGAQVGAGGAWAETTDDIAEVA